MFKCTLKSLIFQAILWMRFVFTHDKFETLSNSQGQKCLTFFFFTEVSFTQDILSGIWFSSITVVTLLCLSLWCEIIFLGLVKCTCIKYCFQLSYTTIKLENNNQNFSFLRVGLAAIWSLSALSININCCHLRHWWWSNEDPWGVIFKS